jgi:hypothetical protein
VTLNQLGMGFVDVAMGEEDVHGGGRQRDERV